MGMAKQIIISTIYVIRAVYKDSNGAEKTKTVRQSKKQSYHTIFNIYRQMKADKKYSEVCLYREKVVWEETMDKLPANKAQEQGRLF